MSNATLQKNKLIGKSHLPSPFYSFRLVLKAGAFRAIMKVKGWKTYEEAGQALGFTRQYIQMADKTGVQVGPEFITRLAACLGNISQGWWIPFEIIPHGVADENHPLWNDAKYFGKIPYRRYSPVGEARKNDYSIEIKNT